MEKSQKTSNKIQEVVIDNPVTPVEKLTWFNINNAGKKEIEFLRKKFNFSLTDLHASSAKTTSQRPVVRKSDGYLFMILHFPIYKDGNIVPEEIEFFVGHGYLVTLHNNNMKEIDEFFKLCKKDGGSLISYEFESSALLLYELLEKLIEPCFQILDRNSIAINQVEDVIFAQKQKKAVSEILSLRHGIINLRKIMQNHKNVLKTLMQMESSLVPPEEIKNYYNKLIERSKRIWEILENQKEMIEILNSTNESLLNYRISDIMKTLTIFSVIVFPLTLLAAIFGMNITNGMPFLNTENGFWIIIIVMLVGCMGMLLFFERKKWL